MFFVYHFTIITLYFAIIFQERIYRNYHNIEFRPQKFTQYLLSSEVGFCKCEVISIPPHPSKGFQRPIHLFTKAENPSFTASEQANDATSTNGTLPNRSERMTRRDQEEIRDKERIKYEQELFPKENVNRGNMSEISQHSGDQYEQLANVYAPSSTPCYDTPSRSSDSQPLDDQSSEDLATKTKKETKEISYKLETNENELDANERKEIKEDKKDMEKRRKDKTDTS